MSKPANVEQKGWAVKTPRGKVLVHTVALFEQEARWSFSGALGRAWAPFKEKGFRLVRVKVIESHE